MLITESVNITVVGGPTLIDGPSGKVIQLDGSSQYLDLGTQSETCLGNPLMCDFGMTVQFNLKLITVVENMYIFTTGGDRPDGYGVAMYYKRSQLYLTVSTTTMEWTVKASVNLNVFFNIEYSWSIQTGLSLYFDGNLVAETKTYISREVTVSQYTVGYIGVSIEINIFANIVIDGWTVTEATKETISQVGEETTTDATTTEMATNATTTEMITNATTTEMITNATGECF